MMKPSSAIERHQAGKFADYIESKEPKIAVALRDGYKDTNDVKLIMELWKLENLSPTRA